MVPSLQLKMDNRVVVIYLNEHHTVKSSIKHTRKHAAVTETTRTDN